MLQRIIVLSIVACFVGLIVVHPAHGQITASATAQGTVMDQTRAVLPGADVSITNKTTGLTRNAVSNEAGIYRFDLLPAGTYQIKASLPGFNTVSRDDVEVLIGRTTSTDFILTAGGVTETVAVTAEASLVDQEKSDVSMNFSPIEVRVLPLNGRDFANLAVLAPGAKPVNSYDPTKNRIAVFGINGSSGRNVNVTVNGIDNKDNTVGGPVMQFPLEGIQEFAISTQRFSAANGRSEGAAVNVVTKSGGNAFHGSGFIYERNERLNANDYFSNLSHNPKLPFSRQQFGGSIGGPIRKDKDFFFFAIERPREITSIIEDPNAYKELQLVQSLGAVPAASMATPYRDWRYTVRLDHRFSDAHSLFATFNVQSNKGNNDQSRGLSDMTTANYTTNKLQLSNITLTSTLSPTVVNAFTVGNQYWNNIIATTKLLPTVNFPGGIYFGTNGSVPQQSYQQKYQFRDDLNISKGKHSLKTGFDFVWEPKLGGYLGAEHLSFTFIDLPSVITTNTTKYPQGFSTPGALSAISLTSGDPYFSLPAKMFGTYFQDDWKATHTLTVNLGIRWDKDYNLIGTQVQAKNRTYLALKAMNNPLAASLPHDDGKDFSPRIGFAWDVRGNGRHTIRGGYGIYYGQTFLNIPLFMIQQANPTLYATALSLSSSGPTDQTADFVPGTGLRLSQWRFGVDPVPPSPPPRTAFVGGEQGRMMDPNYKNPYSQQWNIGYAIQLNDTSVVEAEYVHELGLRESKRGNPNPKRVPLNGGRPLDAAFDAAHLPRLANIALEQSVGRSRYDALNLSYRRRMSRHFSINTNYVLSRALAYNGNSAAFGNTPSDPDNLFVPYDLGPTPNDERHRWVVSGLLDLPKGFQIAPIMQWASARPYTPGQGVDWYGFGSGVGSAHVVLLKNQQNNLTATKDYPAAQLRDCVANGTCVVGGYNMLRGQTFYQLDARVSKDIRLKESMTLKLLFQAFDLTNRANFGSNYVSNIRSTTFGQPNGFITPSGVIVPRAFSGEIGAQFTF